MREAMKRKRRKRKATRIRREKKKLVARSNLIQSRESESRTDLGGYNVLRNNLACNLMVVP